MEIKEAKSNGSTTLRQRHSSKQIGGKELSGWVVTTACAGIPSTTKALGPPGWGGGESNVRSNWTSEKQRYGFAQEGCAQVRTPHFPSIITFPSRASQIVSELSFADLLPLAFPFRLPRITLGRKRLKRLLKQVPKATGLKVILNHVMWEARYPQKGFPTLFSFGEMCLFEWNYITTTKSTAKKKKKSSF